MIVSSVRINDFRNLKDATVNTKANKIFLIGNNGQGKTNFLEALYFCAYGSSFRGSADKEITQAGSKDFSSCINVFENTNNSDNFTNIHVKYENEKKQIFLNEKKINDRKELLSVVPCIVFCHEDMEFVSGSHERRRWFFDQVLSLYDPLYLDDLRCYRRIIKSRNNVLRENNSEALLDALDQQCMFYGKRLMEKRRLAAELFSGIYSDLFKKVADIDGMSVKYSPSWKCGTEREILEHLQKHREADLAVGLSQTGPHRDRYVFIVNNVEYTKTASTGQRRLLALLLRVAQACRFLEMTGKKPVLLLDDVLLEMDGEKRRRFLAALPDYDQAFFTFLPEEPFHEYKNNNTIVYHINDGQIIV